MRLKAQYFIFFLLLCLVPGTAWTQESQTKEEEKDKKGTAQSAETKDKEQEETAEIGANPAVWITHVVEDSSKSEEYGEIPEGFLINSFKASKRFNGNRFLELRGERVGLNNAFYGFDYGVDAAYHLNFDYSKIPHLFSKSGETIWVESSPGVWSISDPDQQAIQNLNPFEPNSSDPNYTAALLQQRQFISGLLSNAAPTQLGLQRNKANVGFEYTPGTNWTYGFEYVNESREGFRPFGTTFGFSWITELPEHIDYTTNRVRARVEYAKNGTTLAAAYEFSGLENDVDSMIWDNPYRLTDRAVQTAGDGPARGRVQLAPDNVSNSFSITGAKLLGKSKITGNFAYASWTDEVNLLPYTINSALEQVALPSATFNGSLRNISADLRYYAQVGAKGSFTANYRFYDQSNHNDLLTFSAFSPTDTSLTLEDAHNHLFAYTRNNLDLDYHHALTRNVRWFAGYSLNLWNRDERETDQTTTNSLRTGLDYNTSEKLILHARYQYDHRTSDEFDLENPTYDVIPLRRFDVANLNRNSFRIIADWMVTSKATLGLSFGLNNNDYPDSAFGLTQLNYFTVGVDFSYSLTENSSLHAWYENARNSSDQNGRQSGTTPSTSDSFDWSADIDDTFNTVGLGFEKQFHNGKCDWNTDVLFAAANGSADFTAGSSIRATGPGNLTDVDDTNHFQFKTGVSTRAFKRIKFAILYWYDRYTIDDFSEESIQTDLILVGTSTPGTILLNARQPDYEFHSGWIGLILSW